MRCLSFMKAWEAAQAGGGGQVSGEENGLNKAIAEISDLGTVSGGVCVCGEGVEGGCSCWEGRFGFEEPCVLWKGI